MTDEPTASGPATDPDDELDQRIRAGIQALAAEAPEPPALGLDPMPSDSEPATVHQLGSPWALVASVAAIVLVVAALAILVTRSDEPDDTVRAGSSTTLGATSTTAVPDRSLYGTYWVLESATQDGKPIEFRRETPPTVEFDDHFTCPGAAGSCSPPTGAAYFYTTGCNSGGGSMRVEGNRVFPSGGAETLVGCTNEVRPFGWGDGNGMDSSTFEIHGDTLVLRGQDGRVLTYRADDELFTAPEDDSQVLVEDHEGTTAYRVLWRAVDEDHYAMQFDRGRQGGIDGQAGIGASADDPKVWVKKASIYGSQDLLYGMVPAETVQVTYVPSKTDPIDVPVLELDGGPFKAVATMVPSGDQSWTVIARDAQGNEIDRQTIDYTGLVTEGD